MELENAFRKEVNSTTVITVKAGEKLNGLTATWVTRVSHSPPLIAISVGEKRYSLGLIRDAGVFCVNILADNQEGLSDHFGFVSGRDKDKLAGVEFESGETGCPIIKNVAAYFDCKVIDEFPAGDHTIFLGEVIDAASSDKKALIFNH